MFVKWRSPQATSTPRANHKPACKSPGQTAPDVAWWEEERGGMRGINEKKVQEDAQQDNGPSSSTPSTSK